MRPCQHAAFVIGSSVLRCSTAAGKVHVPVLAAHRQLRVQRVERYIHHSVRATHARQQRTLAQVVHVRCLILTAGCQEPHAWAEGNAHFDLGLGRQQWQGARDQGVLGVDAAVVWNAGLEDAMQPDRRWWPV